MSSIDRWNIKHDNIPLPPLSSRQLHPPAIHPAAAAQKEANVQVIDRSTQEWKEIELEIRPASNRIKAITQFTTSYRNVIDNLIFHLSVCQNVSFPGTGFQVCSSLLILNKTISDALAFLHFTIHPPHTSLATPFTISSCGWNLINRRSLIRIYISKKKKWRKNLRFGSAPQTTTIWWKFN